MMNLVLILAFTISLPASTLCGETVSEHTSNNTINAVEGKKTNSSVSLRPNAIVKREVLEANEMPYYHFPTAVVSKRSAAVLNKLMVALRNSLDKSAAPYDDAYGGSRDVGSYYSGGEFGRGMLRSSSYDQFPATFVERRGQKNGKTFTRCFFNAVSCFKKRK